MEKDLKETILVVDDEEDILLLCRVNLEFEGYNVITASSGAEGLARAREKHPQLVLLDVMMPTMDGWHVLEALKATPDTEDTPVVMLTARVQGEDQMRGWSGGAADYIMKPFSPVALLETIRSVLHPTDPGEGERRRERSIEKLRLLNSQF
jgi:two-component system, OmpR family, alkaline phosphatase synthesis response regulator PhoP